MEDRKEPASERTPSDVVKKSEGSPSDSERVNELVRRGHLIQNGVSSTEFEVDEKPGKVSASILGQQISHYRIIQKLGAGGMGVVYLAQDTKLDRTVAIKILPDFIAANNEGLKRFVREAKTASAVNHPNVAHIYEIGQQDSIHYIAMEYVEGKTLSESIAAQPLENAEIVRIAIQIADALDSAHSRGIIHRDVKPKNIMITPKGQIKVLDFGLAKISILANQNLESHLNTISATMPGIVLGTTPYMSPEQTKGELADQRTDLFSLGIVLYEMSTGNLPFTGVRVSEIMEQIVQKTPAPIAQYNKNIPIELERIIFKCLEKEPVDRYQTANELLADLQNLEKYLNSQAAVANTKIYKRRSNVSPATLFILLAATVIVLLWQFFKPAKIEHTQLKNVSTFPGSHGAASFSPDGSMIAFVNSVTGVPQIWIKNLNTGDPVPITPAEIPGSGPRWSPLNDQIVFTSGAFELSRMSENIWTVPPLGGAPRKLIEHARNPNWSFDGKLLVFERNAEIWIARADGTEQRKVEGVPKVPVLVADRFPAFSPDSSQIVFFQITYGVIGDYWIIPSQGGQPRQITFDHAAGGRACWTADGKYIVFPSARKGSFTLWKIPSSGGDPVAITTGAGPDADPDISKDGKKLIFINQKYSCTLKLYDTKTGINHDLVTMKDIKAPVFSNDGNKIAFFSEPFSEPHLFTINRSGSDLVQLTRDKDESNIFPRWSHDGKSLFFYQEKPEPSFRKIAINGGPSVRVLDNWIFERENGSQLNPSNEYIVYSKMKEGSVAATLIRHLKTGKERALPVILNRVQWSKNGKWITGTNYENMEENIFICPADGKECRLLTKGVTPVWSPDNSRIFFQRKGELEDGGELWSISIDGSKEKKETELRPMSPIGFFYDVSPTDDIAWVKLNSGPDELWLMELETK